MRLTNTFTVDADIATAWPALSDLPRMAECIPGAAVDDRVGDDYTGHVDVKVGPVGLTLHGTATLVTCDESTHTMVVRGAARDRKGQGSADALITVVATESGSRTEVNVTTDLELGGRIAQFGAGVINKVSSRIIGQFVTRLDAMIAGGDATPDAPTRTHAAVADSSSTAMPILDVAAVAAGFFVLGLAIGRAAYDRRTRIML